MDIVVPGDIIGNSDEFDCGIGCYLNQSVIRSSVCGNVVKTQLSGNKQTISVQTHKGRIAEEGVINVGDKVLCQIQRILISQVTVSIIAVGDKEIFEECKGVIRKEDVTSRAIEIDTIALHDFFRPRDIVRAEVVSLGDAKQYYLSTAGNKLGVIAALSQDGNLMQIINAKEMQDSVTGKVEPRHVAVAEAIA